MASDEVYRQHILDAIARIERHLAGVSEDRFRESELLQDGVVRQLEIVGEASRRLSDAFRRRYPEIPWRQIIGLRNRVAHDYENVNLGVLWSVVRDGLPALKAGLAPPDGTDSEPEVET